MRYAARIDNNKHELVSHFKMLGASVYDIKMPVDLLVGYAGRTALVEVKNPNTQYGRKGFNPLQSAFLQTWNGGTVAIVDSLSAVERLLAVMKGAA